MVEKLHWTQTYYTAVLILYFFDEWSMKCESRDACGFGFLLLTALPSGMYWSVEVKVCSVSRILLVLGQSCGRNINQITILFLYESGDVSVLFRFTRQPCPISSIGEVGYFFRPFGCLFSPSFSRTSWSSCLFEETVSKFAGAYANGVKVSTNQTPHCYSGGGSGGYPANSVAVWIPNSSQDPNLHPS